MTISTISTATVHYIKPLARNTFLLSLECANPFPGLGRFVKLRSWTTTPLLDRPFSVHRTTETGLQFLLSRVGPGTASLTSLVSGDPVKISGPLGRGLDFWPHTRDLPFYLVAGGTGLAPMAGLLDWLNKPARLIYGTKTAQDQVDQKWLESWAPDAVSLTEDGHGYGQKGLVTQALENLLALDPRPIFACGPHPMLRALSSIAQKASQPLWVSLEATMGCGFGVCLSCSLPLIDGGRFRVCQESVIDGLTVDWSQS